MKVSQLKWSNHNWQHISGEVDTKNQLCLLFGSRFNIEADIQTAVAQLINKNPNATVVTASTAGNIADENLIDNTIIVRANFDNLIDGAGESAKETFLSNKQEPELAILISCVARRLVLGELTEEELTEVKKMLGTKATLCGFYSYSELSPVVGNNACQLHNQTMRITTLSEN